MERGSKGDRVRELQARLAQLKWFNARPTGTYGKTTAAAVKGFQAKRELPVTGYVDEATWDRLVGMTRKPTKEQLFPPEKTAAATPVALDPRCMTGRVLCIDKSTRRLRWVTDGQIQMSLAVRFGSEFTPTREGAFDVFWKSRDHYSNTYDSPMPYAMFFSGGQAVHYSADFAARGYDGASHGCVNVRDKAAIASLFDQVRVGDDVIVYRS
jgi:Putative peptidoglycan binding domain/L,D-transpeptidase catalytic domain